ncbi:MAG: amidophosphoribosyltransferase [Bacteroidaceae bacterium]|nr:amidophosphoribosyltransferase [Bacteroidaceae bacterium]
MESLKHECGIAMVRLLKPLEYFQEKYGTWTVGLDELYLLMEKQHNRGQEGAGIACVKMDAPAGEEYMFRERALGSGAIAEVFGRVHAPMQELTGKQMADVSFVRRNVSFAGEIYMGHLRYSTTGRKGIAYVHPFLRRNNWKARNLCLCGNFNMTNVRQIFDSIVQMGQHPRIYGDTYILLEQIGHRLDRESERLFRHGIQAGMQKSDITRYIEDNIDMANVLRTSSGIWDGGYVLCGVTGSGESFVMRDPWGIRPAFWYKNDEQVVVASERPVIQTTLFVESHEVNELLPGQALLISKSGEMRLEQVLPARTLSACSFERIYFSRGNDADIYQERKALGRQLVEPVYKAIGKDLKHTVFSFIPNTAETAFYGLVEGFNDCLNQQKAKALMDLGTDAKPTDIEDILAQRVRSEKVAWKDIKMRTFIAEGNSRNDLASHVYDVTYNSLCPYKDNLVIIDDSIVRGTTLKESILRILDRLHPRKIVVVSSSPQVRYPDYYGIDMPSLQEFIAFRATIALLEDRKMDGLIHQVCEKCRAELEKPADQPVVNAVQEIYAPFTAEEISLKMAQMLRAEDVEAEVEIVYQSLEGLRRACPHHSGDWYFSGNYPTPGGTRRVNQAFVDFVEQVYCASGRQDEP